MTYQEDSQSIKEILIDSKLVSKIESIKPIGHGNNNRAYAVNTPNNKFLAKFYFSSNSDNRSRLENEFNFINFAKAKEINCIPNTILKSDSLNLGIFEYIEGQKFLKEDLNKESVMCCADFFQTLNKPGNSVNLKTLSYASEAFLDLSSYIKKIDKKILKLRDTIFFSNKKDIVSFLDDLQKAWENIKTDLLNNESFITENKSPCISPSDFGFHNTLLSPKGLYFIDFEYAGIDDSSKFISDFFIQPEIKIPIEYMEEFASKALTSFPDSKLQLERTKKLFPMFQIKWCCIMLNEFLPGIAERRVFSNPQLDMNESRKKQLQKAKVLLLEINNVS